MVHNDTERLNRAFVLVLIRYKKETIMKKLLPSARIFSWKIFSGPTGPGGPAGPPGVAPPQPAVVPPNYYYPQQQNSDSSIFFKVVIGGGCGCLGLVGLAVIIFIVWAMTLPDPGAKPGSHLSAETIEYLETNGLIEPGKEVIFFYDHSLNMNNSELCFFTDDKIVYYFEGKTQNEIMWDAVTDIEFRDEFFSTVISVSAEGKKFLRCEITQGGPDFQFAVESKWESVQAKR